MASAKKAPGKLSFTAHFGQRGYGGGADGRAGTQEVRAVDLEAAREAAGRLACSKGFVLTDVTGPDEED